jgi:hypothetical protein
VGLNHSFDERTANPSHQLGYQHLPLDSMKGDLADLEVDLLHCRQQFDARLARVPLSKYFRAQLPISVSASCAALFTNRTQVHMVYCAAIS